MPITYQIVGCTNPRGAEGVDYATNRAVKTGDYDFKSLAEAEVCLRRHTN